MCQDSGNTIKPSGFSERHADAEAWKQAGPWPHMCKQQSIQWPLYSGSLNAALNYSLHSSETSRVKICATLTTLSLEKLDSDPNSVFGLRCKPHPSIAEGKPTTHWGSKLPRALICTFLPSLQHVTELLSITGLHWKPGENKQMSMLLMVISSERLRWVLITKSVNCCSLTLQFHSKRWSWRAVFSLALWWGAERAQSDNQNQKCCCSLTPCEAALWMTSTGQ